MSPLSFSTMSALVRFEFSASSFSPSTSLFKVVTVPFKSVISLSSPFTLSFKPIWSVKDFSTLFSKPFSVTEKLNACSSARCFDADSSSRSLSFSFLPGINMSATILRFPFFLPGDSGVMSAFESFCGLPSLESYGMTTSFCFEEDILETRDLGLSFSAMFARILFLGLESC